MGTGFRELRLSLQLKGSVTSFYDRAAFSPDGRFVAANSRVDEQFLVEVFDVATGKVTFSKAGWMPQFLPDSKSIFLVKDQSLEFWESNQGKQLGSRHLDLGKFWQDGTPMWPNPIQVPTKPTVLVVDPKPPFIQSIATSFAMKIGLTGNNLAHFFAYFECTNVFQIVGPSGRTKTLRLNGVSVLDSIVWAKDGNMFALTSITGELSVWRFPPRKSIRFVYWAFTTPLLMLLIAWVSNRLQRRRMRWSGEIIKSKLELPIESAAESRTPEDTP